MNNLDESIILAVTAHAGQTDKIGLPYILHPLRVMNAVKNLGEDAMCAAVLHDVLEDTELKFKDILILGENIASTVLILSRIKSDGITYKEFIEKIRDSNNKIAMAIKIVDLKDNLSRISCLPESERTIANRYIRALKILGESYE